MILTSNFLLSSEAEQTSFSLIHERSLCSGPVMQLPLCPVAPPWPLRPPQSPVTLSIPSTRFPPRVSVQPNTAQNLRRTSISSVTVHAPDVHISLSTHSMNLPGIGRVAGLTWTSARREGFDFQEHRVVFEQGKTGKWRLTASKENS